MKKHEIGTRIRLLRGRESRPSFAERFGVSVATLARYESGETAPNALFIMELCDKYDVGTDWLLYGKETGSPGTGETEEASRLDLTSLQGTEPKPAASAGPSLGHDWPKAGLKNEVENSNLISRTKTLDCDDFDLLWSQFKSESEARRGWLQIELIKRFPEFLEWLESRPFPLSSPLPTALIKDEPLFHPILPPAAPKE